ncbi:MAG: hypothetical protein IIC67_07100 [Thaumarchaeota archaeon]|nr:hypothetical protein [Nitrososphaerota archaeon]
MYHNPYQAQKETRNGHKTIILDALKDSPQRFTDLLTISKLSPAGLTNILKSMIKEKSIKQNPTDKMYSFTNLGLELLKSADITHILNRIRNDDGVYYRNYSGVFDTILSHKNTGVIYPFLCIDKNLDSLNLLSTDDVKEVNKLLLKKLSNSINRNKLIEKNTGEIVLGFVINYQNAEKILKKPKRGKKK